MKPKIFIDGEAGTTGLQIRDLLAEDAQLELLQIDVAERKNPDVKKALMAEADLLVLCLHDDAARESVSMAEALPLEQQPRIIDASSAHRTASDWVYGFAELEPSKAQAIRDAKRLSNPGCHASGAIALLAPLLKSGILPPDFPLSIHSVSGYSGGGRSMIEAYEQSRAPLFELYGLALRHKHVPEIMMHAGLSRRPIFVPSVGNFRQGMLVSIPLHLDELPGRPGLAALESCYRTHYDNERFKALGLESAVEFVAATEDCRIDALATNGSNRMEIRVYGHGEHRQAVLVARFDNLGKGASRAAVQNMNNVAISKTRRGSVSFALRLAGALGIALGLAVHVEAIAQPYPSKPIKMISAYTAGGLSDTVARGFAEKMAEVLGTQVIVENRPGAGTTLATKSIMASPPDGYTIYCGTTSLVINPALQANAGYDWRSAVMPVALMMSTPFILHTNLNLPAKSARELTDLVKANPGKFSYGSSGNGAVNHMAGELWKSKAGLDITHVPYKGGMPAATDMIGGSIDMMFSAVLEAKPMIDSGKTKGMAVSSAKRIDIMPQLPTLAEALGIPSLVAEFWMGLYVPPGTPQSIIDKLAVTVQKIASDAAFRERFAKQGVTVRSSSTQELKEFMEQEARQWTEIIRANNIKS